MTTEIVWNLKHHIWQNGIDATIDGYSTWEDIDDIKFHELRKKYLAAKKELENYIFTHELQ